MEAVEVNFDGITYAKGASVIKQLVAYVGLEPFLTGLRAYFAAHAWGNATFNDLLSALEEASGKPLREFAAQWLETAQVNTLRPVVTIGADGTYTAVAVAQEAPADYPTLRTHRLAIGLYDLRRRPRWSGATGSSWTSPARGPRCPQLVGVTGARRAAAQRRGPDLRQAAPGRAVDGHRGRAHRRLRRRRCRGRCAGRPPGTCSATPSWPPATTPRWSAPACPRETDINLVTATLRQVAGRGHPVRRPGLGADRLGSCSPTPPGRPGRDRAGQRVPARLGPRVRRRRPDRRRPGRAARLAATATASRPGWPSTPTCAGALLSALVADGHGRAGRDRGRAGPGPHRERRAGRRAGPGAGADGRSPRRRPGAGSPATSSCPTGCSARCCWASSTRPSWR